MKKKVVLIDKKGQKERYFKKAKEKMEKTKKDEASLNTHTNSTPNTSKTSSF